MRYVIMILALAFSFTASAQVYQSYPQYGGQWKRLRTDTTFILPRYADTVEANIHKGYDSCGAMFFAYGIDSLYYRACNPKRWVSIGSGSGGGSNSSVNNYRITTEGQSNNIGVGFVSELTETPISSDNYSFTAEQSRVYIFNPQTGVYEKLYVPNNNQAANNAYYINVSPTAPAFGPELGIAQRWMQSTSPADTLFIDKNSVDGGLISQFQSGTDYYDTILARRAIANAWLIARGKTVIDIGYQWVQGESNLATSEATYESSLETLINDRVADGLIDTIRGVVILAQISTSSTSYGAGPAAAKISYVAAHSFARLTTYSDNFNTDNVHLNAIGQLQLGYDGYQQILQTGSRAVGLFSLTNVGRTGVSSFSGSVLNIPNYYNIIPIDTIVPADPNLKAYYPMEETSGDILDASGNGFNLARVNGVTSVSGQVSLGSGFAAASTQRLQGSASNSLSAGAGLTVACWSKITSGTAGVVMGKYNTTGGNAEYLLYWSSTFGYRFAMSDDGTYQVGHDLISSSIVSYGTWHYVVGVWDGATMYLYVDNVLTASTALSSAFNTGSANFSIGDASPSLFPHDGVIDEAMVFDRALTPTELTYYYNSGVGRTMALSTSTNTYGIVDTLSTTIIQVPNLEIIYDATFKGNGTPGVNKVPTGSDADGNWTWGTPTTLDTSNKWVNSITRTPGKDSIIFYIGSTRYAIKDSTGGKPSLNKGFFLESPTSSEAVDMWQTPVAITVTSLKAILRGSSPSVTYNIKFGTDITSATSVFTSDITCTSVTTGCSNSSGFNDATIPAGSFIWIVSTAASGTITSIAFTLNYTED